MELVDYMKAGKMLKKYHIGSIRSSYVSTSAEAIRFAGKKAIVLKLISDKALHKSKAGLVKVNLSTKQEITSAFGELAKKGIKLKPYKIIAQDMAKSGIEIIIGGKIDQQFGKMVLIGLGGIYVETFKDVSLRICPITRTDAEDMIDQLKSGGIITGNGQSRKMIVDLLLNTSKLFSDCEVSELDLNPVIVRNGSYDVVDIRMIR